MPASQTREIARSALRGNWVTAVLITLVAGILGGTSNAFSSSASSAANNAVDNSGYAYRFFYDLPSSVSYAILGILGTFAMVGGLIALVTLVLGGAIRQGLCQYNINLVKKDAPAEFGLLFSKFSNFGKCFLLNLLMTLFIFLWSLLFIIPGIIAAYRYAMAPYIMAQNPNIGAMDALTASKEMMRGHKADLFFLNLSFIGWAFLAVFTCGIGILWLNPYTHAAEATFYLNLTGQLPGMQYAAPGGYPPPPAGGAPYGQGYQQPPQGAPGQDYGQQAYTPPPQYDAPPPPAGTYPPPEAPPREDPPQN